MADGGWAKVGWAEGGWEELIRARNDQARAAGRWRSIRSLDSGTPPTSVTSTGQPVVSFASNDYLGLSQHPAVIAAARDALARYGTGAGAARLIVGARPVHAELEAELADWSGREAALLFPTGFQANLGVIGALAAAAGPECIIYSDELNHASIIDGIRGTRRRVVVYRHGDVDHLATLLDEQGDGSVDGPAVEPSARQGPPLVVTDSVFSMDGDLAPVADLEKLCQERGALLVVDEAHALLGPTSPSSAVVVGTLSKTFGAVGGFVAADRDVIDLCINTARSFIFTTAGAPADAAAALASLRIQRSDEGAELRDRLRANIELLRPGHPSPIIPVMLGSEERAVAIADELLTQGLLVPAIRPPTVAPGTCRLRLAVSAAHSPEDLLRLADALKELGVDL